MAGVTTRSGMFIKNPIRLGIDDKVLIDVELKKLLCMCCNSFQKKRDVMLSAISRTIRLTPVISACGRRCRWMCDVTRAVPGA